MYASLTWSKFYENFINGWFSHHIKQMVGTIVACQAFIAMSMLMPGRIFKLGAIAAIVFLAAILPLGVGAGFPSTFIMSLALLILLLQVDSNYSIITTRKRQPEQNHHPG